MSKELEALKRIRQETCPATYMDDFDKNECCDVIEQALLRLETIDNAEPSEALECLEKLKGMEISSMPFGDEYGIQEVDLNDIRKVGSQLNTDFREYTTTIKQALLKAQYYNSNNFKGSKEFKIEIPESSLMDYNPTKQYLKWEDLEFDDKEQRMDVSLNGHPHLLCYYRTLFDSLCMIDNTGITIREDNKYFFNDLHLERVEE